MGIIGETEAMQTRNHFDFRVSANVLFELVFEK